MTHMNQSDENARERAPFLTEDNLTVIHSRLSYKRTVRVMCFLLVIGMILLAAGLASLTLLNRGVSSVLRSELIASEADSGEKLDALAREASVKMLSALVKEDYNGFFDAYSAIPDDIYDLIGNPYMKKNLFGSFFSSARERNLEVARYARENLVADAGSYWTVLEVAIYFKEMIIAGAALIVVSLLGIFMKGARFRDLRFSKCWPILLVFLACAAAVVLSRRIEIKF